MLTSVRSTLPDRETCLQLYDLMLRSRIVEDKIFSLLLTGTMPGTVHQYNGEEAVAAGVCANLRQDDYITSTHRGHGHYASKGGNLNALMAEMFAKRDGCCRGMGGSMHVADFSVGMLGATGIVGAGIPIAVGAALSCQMRGTDQVAVSFFGDGASNIGAFHEGLNLAAVWQLPVIFVCENNLYGFSTPLNQVLRIPDIANRADGYGIPAVVADGMDPAAVYQTAREAVERARQGDGPTLLECKTYRFKGHSRFEPGHYRTKEELAAWQERDPLITFPKRVCDEGLATEAELAEMEAHVKQAVEEAVAFAQQSPAPEPTEALQLVFAQ